MTTNIPDKFRRVQRIEELKNKVLINFRYSMRDNAALLRMIPLKEFLSWSEENPDAMLEADIRGYILRGLRDSVMRNRKITLNVKNASKLVENFMSYFITQTTWQDWEFFLKSCFDNEVDEYLHILYLYVSFINRPSLHDLDRSTITKMKDEFSVYFSVGWLQLMETDKITMNSNAQIFMLKLATSFNVLKLFKKTLAKMIDWCLNTFCRSHNKEVLDECLSCINYLNSFNKNIEIERSLISQVVTEFIEILNSENEETKILHLSYYKVLLLVKIYEDSCGNLWRSLVSSLEKERDLEKVDLIISILYCLCIKKMFRYFGFEKLSEISNEDLLSEDEKSFQQFILKAQVTSCRTIVIQAASDLICYISNHINENDNFPKIMLVPLLYGELISYSKCPPFSEFISEFSDTSVESYVIYCSRITNTNCQRKGSSPCCVLLNRYVKHTIAGNICT
ncbi:uncharacterized protein, partial [Halyomorpha halys]|uniref:uncharacterized protein n=1 Tax=Halyomorpha halys TaxID=286706 RepID=UPI0006D51E0F